MEKEKSVKIWFFLGLTFFASFFLGKTASLFFSQSFFEIWDNFLGLLLKIAFSFIFTGLTFSLPALFLKKEKRLLTVLTNCFCFLFGFVLFSGLEGLTTGFFLTIVFFASQHIFLKSVSQREKKFIFFSSLEIFSSPLKFFLLNLSLVLSVSLFVSLYGQVLKPDFAIPDEFFEKLAKPVNQIFKRSFEQSLKMQLGDVFEKSLGTRDSEEILKFLEQEAKETAQEGTLRQQFGLRPEIFNLGNLSVSSLAKQLRKQIEPLIRYLPFIIALSLFLTLRFVVSFLMIILSLLVSLVFKILIKFQVFYLVEKSQQVQRLAI